MTRTANIACVHEYGAPEVLKFETTEVAEPVVGEALVRNTAIGLNFTEICYRRGTFKLPQFPAVIGNEAAGVVEAVGPGVTSVRIGDRVVYA
jgi:NADPH2:quinone reductase